MTRSLQILALLLLATFAGAQTNQEKAEAKGKEAIQLMDAGKVDESIKLLEEAQQLDPERFEFKYEIAYAHYLKQNYEEVIRILEKHREHKDETFRLYQLLGNAYDVNGRPEKALETYDAGLKKFPNSGPLHLEKGNVYWAKQEYVKALDFYEAGIKADPKFPSNYYRAARIYCNSTERVWGMIYGEIFMNLERNSQRTVEISKLLYDTYDAAIKPGGKSMSVSFSKVMVIDAEALKDTAHPKLPFSMVYEMNMVLSILMEKKIDINSLDRIRSNFVENYFSKEHHKTHPNILFDYQKKLADLGHLEAYNHWILMKGDEKAFSKWQEKNEGKWEAFVKWFSDNKLKVDETRNFHSSQY